MKVVHLETIITTSFARVQRIVSVNDFRLPMRLQRTFANFSVFPEKFLFCKDKIGSAELPSLVPRQRVDLSWNHCTSTPHRSETNGIAERAVR